MISEFSLTRQVREDDLFSNLLKIGIVLSHTYPATPCDLPLELECLKDCKKNNDLKSKLSEHSACRIDVEVAVGKAVVALGLVAACQCKSLPFRIEKMFVFALSNTGFQQFFRHIWRQQEV